MPGPIVRSTRLLLLVTVLSACGPARPMSDVTPGTGLAAVWTISGETSRRSLFDTTYFTDPGAPVPRSGAAWLQWRCTGAGRLEVALVSVDRRGPMEPDLSRSTGRMVVGCPSTVGGSEFEVRPIPGNLDGTEDAIVIRSAFEPSTTMAYTVVVAQAP